MNKECKAGHVNLVYFEREWNTDNCFETLGILITAFFLNQIRYILKSETIESPEGKMGYLPLAINYRQIEQDAVYTQGVTSTHKV